MAGDEHKAGKGGSAEAGEELTSHLEDYLEVIAELQAAERVARAKDIAERMSVTKGTVTAALKSLSQKGLINYQPYSTITLTGAGRDLARDIIHRHDTLTRYLHQALGLPRDLAEANACRAEHVLGPEVIERMGRFLEFMETCPRTGADWRAAFVDYCQGQAQPESCKECVGQCLAGLYQEDA